MHILHFVYTVCVKKNGTVGGKNHLGVKSFHIMCVCGTKLKPKDFSCWCALSCIICFRKTKVMLSFVRRGTNRNYALLLFWSAEFTVIMRNRTQRHGTACEKWIFLDCRKLVISQKILHQMWWKKLQKKEWYSCFMKITNNTTLILTFAI